MICNPDESLRAHGECGSDAVAAESAKVVTAEEADRAERFATISRLNPKGDKTCLVTTDRNKGFT